MESVELKTHPTAESFLAAVSPFALPREAEHGLLLGLATAAQSGGQDKAVSSSQAPKPDVEPCFASVGTPDASFAAVAKFPPAYLFILAASDEKTARRLAEAVHAYGFRAPGVVGTKPLSGAFAGRWSELAGCLPKLSMDQLIYELTAVIPPDHPPNGRLRRATQEEIELIASWMLGFRLDALPNDPPGKDVDFAAAARARIETGSIHVWETDAGPVCMAAFARPTLNGVTINLVYTPPEHRKRGYASAMVAALSQVALDQGKKACFLYTDATNPTSNAIYQRIGYRLVCASEHWSFT